MLSAARLKSVLGLRAHTEGGYFVETYRSQETLPAGRGRKPHALSTAIYYMVTAESPCRMHRLSSDEAWHFYTGDPLDMLLLFPDGTGKRVTLGNTFERGMRPQLVVPRGTWQGAAVKAGGEFALAGTTVAPGFDYADFETGTREELTRRYPGFKRWIAALTR